MFVGEEHLTIPKQSGALSKRLMYRVLNNKDGVWIGKKTTSLSPLLQEETTATPRLIKGTTATPRLIWQ